MKDPHLIPLGYYLVWVEQQAGWEWEDADHLEKLFLEEPWLNQVQVVLAVNPEGLTKPFALLCNTHGQPHTKCPFYNVDGENPKVLSKCVRQGFRLGSNYNFDTQLNLV